MVFDMDNMGEVIQTGFFAGLDIATTVILILVLVISIMCAFMFFMYVKSFKNKLRLREVINNRKIIKDYRFKEYKDKDEVYWYKVLFNNLQLPRAPSEAIDVDSHGNKVIEAYKLETGEIVYIHDMNNAIPKKIFDIENMSERKEEIKKYLKENKNVINNLEPLATEQRLTMAHQVIKAQSKKKTGLTDMIMQLGPMVLMVLVIFGLLTFWGELSQSSRDAQAQATAQMTIQTEQLKLIKEIKQNIQNIEGEKVTTINNNAPN